MIAPTHQHTAAQKFKDCHDCEKPKAPEGGIQLSGARWVCKTCWSSVQMKINRKMQGSAWGKGTTREQRN